MTKQEIRMLQSFAEKLKPKGYYISYLEKSNIVYVFRPKKKSPKRFTDIQKAINYLRKKAA
jgi:hypothetical protein